MADGGVGCLDKKTGEGDLRYAPAYGDIAPGRIGNGEHVYQLPLADDGFRSGALMTDNVVCKSEDGRGPTVRVRDPKEPGRLILRMPSSYVYLGGTPSGRAAMAPGGRIDIRISDNNGADWRDLAHVTKSGPLEADLGPHILRRYDYQLMLVMTGSETGLDSLCLRHDIQHSQRALPALDKGRNTIRFSAAPDEGTITVEGSTNPADHGRQLVTSDFHATLDGVAGHLLRVEGGQGSVTFPIATPGDMLRLRLGCHFRARDARDEWQLQASFDGGATFKPVDRFAGPTPGTSRYLTCDDIPPGTRSALVRFAGTQRNTTCIFSYRIDADYREPHGGFRPVRIHYEWTENGVDKRHDHVARKPRESYTIDCEAKPVMRSISLELAEQQENRR